MTDRASVWDEALTAALDRVWCAATDATLSPDFSDAVRERYRASVFAEVRTALGAGRPGPSGVCCVEDCTSTVMNPRGLIQFARADPPYQEYRPACTEHFDRLAAIGLRSTPGPVPARLMEWWRP